MLRQCSRCKSLLDESQFFERNDNKQRSDVLSSHCLSCQRAISKASYERNKEERQRKARERKEAIKAGIYVPDSTKARHKRRVDLPPRETPNLLLFCHVDKHKQAFVEAEANRRGVNQEEIVREFIRAAMSAVKRGSEEIDKGN